MPVPPGWCFDRMLPCSCVLCVVTDLVSLSSWCSYDARFADEFTLDQLKFNSINTTRFTSYF
jgi:hypothetical protein